MCAGRRVAGSELGMSTIHNLLGWGGRKTERKKERKTEKGESNKTNKTVVVSCHIKRTRPLNFYVRPSAPVISTVSEAIPHGFGVLSVAVFGTSSKVRLTYRAEYWRLTALFCLTCNRRNGLTKINTCIPYPVTSPGRCIGRVHS